MLMTVYDGRKIFLRRHDILGLNMAGYLLAGYTDLSDVQCPCLRMISVILAVKFAIVVFCYGFCLTIIKREINLIATKWRFFPYMVKKPQLCLRIAISESRKFKLGFFGWNVYAIKPDTTSNKKPTILRCRECSI